MSTTGDYAKLKKAEILLFLTSGKTGFVSEAAMLAKVENWNLRKWRLDDPVFAEAIVAAVCAAKEVRLDFAEAKLLENIGNNDNAAIIFYLKTQGRERDYGDKIEHNHSVTPTIDIDEAARRIAFAMNAAILSGRALEGNYSEVVKVPGISDARDALAPESKMSSARKKVLRAEMVAAKAKAAKVAKAEAKASLVRESAGSAEERAAEAMLRNLR